MEPPITTKGRILAAHADGRTFDAALPNGKTVRAFLPRWADHPSPPLQPGDEIPLELTPYDFSKARIALPRRKNSLATFSSNT
ncbi:hypothetical protein BH23VER1_BH23VER1_18850 [soil metagenome]